MSLKKVMRATVLFVPVMLASAMSAGTAAAGPTDWCHDYLRSADGFAINFDYQVIETGPNPNGPSEIKRTTSPAWLNVVGASFSGAEHVSAVIVTHGYSEKCGPVECGLYDEQVHHVDLAFAGGNRFTGQVSGDLPFQLYVEGDDDATQYLYEIAVVVDGRWLKDPVSGSSNFRYTPQYADMLGCLRR